MKVAVVTSFVPFARDEPTEIAAQLSGHLEAGGHLVDVIRLPFRREPFSALPAQIAAAQQLRLDAADKVIALTFPAYLVSHDNKTLWLLQRFRAASGPRDLPGLDAERNATSEADDEIRTGILEAEIAGLREARAIFTSSLTLSDQLRSDTGLGSEMLAVPAATGAQTATNPALADSSREPATTWPSTIERLLA